MFEMRPFNRKNSMRNYNPFNELDDMEKSFFGNPFGFFEGGLSEFKTDISDNGSEYLLEADMPGFKKEDINLDINGDTLTISAVRRSDREEKDKKNNYIRRERSYGEYSRQFDVSGVDTAKIKAKYDNGILKLTMPKKDGYLNNSKHLEIE